MSVDDDGNSVTKMDSSTLKTRRTALMNETRVETGIVDVMRSANVD